MTKQLIDKEITLSRIDTMMKLAQGGNTPYTINEEEILINELGKLYSNIKNQTGITESQWIDVKDRLPEEWGEYQVYCREHGVSTREFDREQDKWIHGDRQSLYSLETISYWKPLDLPPVTK